MSILSLLSPLRAKGLLQVSFKDEKLVNLHETGGFRLKFPFNETLNEAVMVNTSGGLVGGDRLDLTLKLENSSLMLSNTGAEKIYDAKGLQTQLSIEMTLQKSNLLWLPQETILYNGGNFKRQFTLKTDAASRFILCEAIVFGRLLSGESLTQAFFQDSWRIWREKQLIHAEEIAFEGALHEKLDSPAIGNGARAIATILIQDEALDTKKEALNALALPHAAFSVKNNLLLARVLTQDAEILRFTLRQIFVTIGITIPRTW